MTPDRHQVLIDLHNDKFSEELIGEEFDYIFKNILEPAERDVLLMLIHGLKITQIAQKRGCTVSSVKRRLYEIKHKYRNGMGNRVSDWRSVRNAKAKV